MCGAEYNHIFVHVICMTRMFSLLDRSHIFHGSFPLALVQAIVTARCISYSITILVIRFPKRQDAPDQNRHAETARLMRRSTERPRDASSLIEGELG
jgi:hypothetical protein